MNSFVCPTCNMAFRSSYFLAKHEKKFCIGGAYHTEEADFHQNLTARRLEDQHLQNLPKMGKQKLARSADGKHLNKHRREMDLQKLSAQDLKMAQLEEMLYELQQQEQRHTSLLESLMNHVQHGLRESMTFNCKGENLHIPENSEQIAQTYTPVYDGGAVSAEISTLRLSYLQRGGKDPQILSQMQDMLDEALKVEMQHGKAPHLRPSQTERTKHRPKPQDSRRDYYRELVSTELENQRLEKEITRLQLKRRSAFTRTPHCSICQPHEQEMKSMKMEIDRLKHEIEINHLKRQMRCRNVEPTLSTFPPLEEPRSQTPPFIPLEEGMDPALYDSIAGFMVFYDFLLGLPPCYRVCRLMVALYAKDQCLGTPFVLPPVYCGPFSLSSHPPSYNLGQKAVIATKQAVPEVQPAPSVCLVIEVQASGGYDIYGQEVTSLAPRGWVKLHIFDHHNRIISGRWKIPVRILPAKPSLTTAEVNSVSQLDNAELFLRIVNARDAEIQSSVPISTHTAGIYRYPPVITSRRRFTRQDSQEVARTSNVQSDQVCTPAFSQILDQPATGV